MARRLVPYLLGLFTGLLASGILYLMLSPPRGSPIALQPPPTPGPIRVHIAGSVNQPGVYSLDRRAIVAEAIEAAGGASVDANLELVNLAAPLSDGAKVTVPAVGDLSAGGEAPQPVVEPASSQERLDINSATAPELERLPGIGPSLAEEIVSFRNANGPFQTVDDLQHVSGIGPAKLDAIRDLVEVR